MKLGRILAAIAALCLVTVVGCSAPASKQAVELPDPESAVNPELCRVYFFRDKQNHEHLIGMEVRDGKLVIGELYDTTYLCWERAPGRTLITVAFNPWNNMKDVQERYLDLECPAGGTVYCSTSLEVGIDKPLPRILTAKEGMQMLADRKPPKPEKD